MVHSTAGGRVFINGKSAGELETPIAWGCGPRSIAIAKFDKFGHPFWMTKPQWFNVKCGVVITEVTVK